MTIHARFREFVQERRAQLDMEKVGTGEAWLGSQALELGLVDELATSDEIIRSACQRGRVLHVSFKRKHTLSERVRVTLPNGMDIRLITAPLFVATKFEAFHGRGNNDFLASHDLEDIITVVDGRPELMQEIDQAKGELRRHIATEFNILIEDRDFLMALAGHLPGDAASQARLPELIRRMRAIGSMTQ